MRVRLRRHGLVQPGNRTNSARGGMTMSLFPLRERALAISILGALAAACASPTLAQEKAAPPNFSWDPAVGWIGMGEFRPVPGHAAPVSNDPKHPYVPNGQGRQPTYRIADLSHPNLKPWVKEIM